MLVTSGMWITLPKLAITRSVSNLQYSSPQPNCYRCEFISVVHLNQSVNYYSEFK